MSQLAQITNENQSSQNLLSRYGNFEGVNFYDITSGVGIVNTSTDFAFNGSQSLKIVNQRFNTNVPLVIAPIDNRLDFTAPRTATYYFALRVAKNSEFVYNGLTKINVTVFINAVANNYDLEISNDTPFDTWLTFGQLISLNVGDELSFGFTFLPDTTSSDDVASVFIDSLQIALSNEAVQYSVGQSGANWERLLEYVNTQSIPANTNTNINFSTAFKKSFGNIQLIDTAGNVVPFALNDVITVDFSFDFEVPSGANHFLHLQFVVNGQIYRATTLPIVKASADTEYVSVSYVLPVEQEFLQNGGTLRIFSSVAIGIKNKYLNVVRYE